VGDVLLGGYATPTKYLVVALGIGVQKFFLLNVIASQGRDDV